MKVQFELDAMEKLPVGSAITAVMAMVEALAVVDQVFLKSNPDTPVLYDLASEGKITQRQGHASGTWSDIPRVLSDGYADAISLVCWRIAELRVAGHENVHPYIKTNVNEANTYIHQVFIRIGDCIEDPSKLVAKS